MHLFTTYLQTVTVTPIIYTRKIGQHEVTNCTEYEMSLSWLNSHTILDTTGSLSHYDQCPIRDKNPAPTVNKAETLEVQAT
jgi:hypothetical protein